MRKLAIISFYELRDYLYAIGKTFADKYKWDIICYPLYMYCYDRYSKLEDYSSHMSDFFLKEKPDIVLWWFTDVPLGIFNRIKNENPDIFFVIYNYSDPMNINKMYLERCSIFDHVLTVCQQNLPIYKLQSKNSYVDFFPMGYDKELFKILNKTEKDILDKKYDCDISFICDSIYYDQKDQLITRKDLINTLIEYGRTNKVKINIYGPESIQHIAKEYYIGEVNYIDIPSIATLSKINIITHSDSRKKLGLNNMYLMPIMACGGIILMDKINGSELFFNGTSKTIFTFDFESKTKSLISNITKILNTYNNEYDIINEIKLNASIFAKKFSWDEFSDRIYMRYIQDRFNEKFYKKIYNLSDDLSSQQIMNIWHNAHIIGDIQIPYVFEVPTNFDDENYRLRTEFDKNKYESEYVYIHWYMNGKNNDFLKRSTSKNTLLSGGSYNMLTSKIFDMYRGFNMLYIYRDIDTGLDILHNISKQNPRLQINESLSKYIDICMNE